jgi:hypothetical protein
LSDVQVIPILLGKVGGVCFRGGTVPRLNREIPVPGSVQLGLDRTGIGFQPGLDGRDLDGGILNWDGTGRDFVEPGAGIPV